MDHSEQTILDMLKENAIVTRTEVFRALPNIPKVDVEEAIQSLENQKYLVRVSPIGEESYSITKTGLEKLEKQQFFDEDSIF